MASACVLGGFFSAVCSSVVRWRVVVVWDLVVYLAAYHVLAAFHEAMHILAACSVGMYRAALTTSNLRSALLSRHVRIQDISGWRAEAVRHAGWLGSTLAALVMTYHGMNACLQTAAWLTALDGISSDLIESATSGGNFDIFRCGNFGVLVLDKERRKNAIELLKTMVRVTMMRGAQSGGVVTYVPSGGGSKGSTGVRSRVVNGKRTDLSALVTDKLRQDEFWASLTNGLNAGVRFYAGHTRFATSSIASLPGTHPHQWSKPAVYDYYRIANGTFEKLKRTVEVFICHNGDLDFFDVGGVTYDLGDVMNWLERALHTKKPATVDSAGVAGLIDIVRTQGLWFHSVRFGYLFGPKRTTLEYPMPSLQNFQEAASMAAEVFEEVLKKLKGQSNDRIRDGVKDSLLNRITRQKVLGFDLEGGNLVHFVNTAVDAFFDQDLLAAVRLFLANAKGSFGLCITCSVDADRQLVVAARGQTISVAFYPASGLVLWGSEQAAVKAALVGEKDQADSVHGRMKDKINEEREVMLSMLSPEQRAKFIERFGEDFDMDEGACRLDLDDLGGEIVLIDWGEGPASISHDTADLPRHSMMNGKVTLIISEESKKKILFKKRLVRLAQNQLIKPLPKHEKDHVFKDISDIPQALSNIQSSWMSGESINNIASWCMGKAIIKRLKDYAAGTHNGSIDILVTGCEVSLWVGEQWCADMAQVFPRLNIKCISANKLLGLFGQEFPIPVSGHRLHESAWNLLDTCTLIISHSGGTFGSLAVSNLLQAYTEQIFVVASESDTQIGKQLRQMASVKSITDIKCPIFSTEVGLRPAEPCTISVAASHQILTQILIDLMRKVQLDGLDEVSGGMYTPEDIKVLEDLNIGNLLALETITGYTRNNDKMPTEIEALLRAKGNFWALHVLENPMSWMFSFVYIMATVVSGYPLIHGLITLYYAVENPNKATQDKSCVGIGNVAYPWNHVVAAADALIYIFCPQWTILILRGLTGRKFLHRMVGRSVVIGDIPWVAQSVEAYLSKLFACAYSATGLAVYSANPTDHLVHRMTHRVVRGGLLACGRPDGRLMAMTTAEAAVCLSVSQASSILSIGSTLESLTIGHNPFPLPLAEHNLFLPTFRKKFLCECALTRKGNQSDAEHEQPSAPIPTSRQKLLKFVNSLCVQYFIMMLVVVDIINVIVQDVYHGEGYATLAGTVITIFVLACFLVEVTLRQIAMGCSFFHSGWNIADFLIIYISIILAIVMYILQQGPLEDARSATTAVRMIGRLALVLRILRIGVKLHQVLQPDHVQSVGALLGAYSNMKKTAEHEPTGDQFRKSAERGHEKASTFVSLPLDDIMVDPVAINHSSMVHGVHGVISQPRNGHSHATAELVFRSDAKKGSVPAQDESIRSNFSPYDIDISDRSAQDRSTRSINQDRSTHLILAEKTEQALKQRRAKKKQMENEHAKAQDKHRWQARDTVGVEDEEYYGEHMEKEWTDVPLARLCEEQVLIMRLYETRIASLQRCVAFFVLFHQMGKRVADFWSWVSFGYLGYEISRTHSIMRIATTASPVSGAEVRDRTIELGNIKRLKASKKALLEIVKARRQWKIDKVELEQKTAKKKQEREMMLNLLSPEQRAMFMMLAGDEDDMSEKGTSILMKLAMSSAASAPTPMTPMSSPPPPAGNSGGDSENDASKQSNQEKNAPEARTESSANPPTIVSSKHWNLFAEA